ncbi:DUF397 domain-containing protein [Actinoalloteichus sp. GBA129-24]|uniref:DUF397 domain-containing protein n=1 Tax=Actinoalloteichus sp. GBA129-24 TaxID=1612551 RepID=UPI0009503896|nr:DUF397 domain-containing protein [Actinoalloteichus sp. GBA129-24]APU18747.1 putative DUF397 family protein [Actinoalloteichus sp. GBA129-24]
MTQYEQRSGAWRTSSYTANQTSCIEIARSPALVGIRDTKDRHGGTLHVDPATFGSFVASIKADRLR